MYPSTRPHTRIGLSNRPIHAPALAAAKDGLLLASRLRLERSMYIFREEEKNSQRGGGIEMGMISDINTNIKSDINA